MEVQKGNTIKVHYTGTLEDGSEFDSSYKREQPIQLEAGAGTTIPGFDNAVLGMTVGEKKTVNIPAEEAYGPQNPEAMVEIPKEHFPEGFEFIVGNMVQGQNEEGQPVQAIILEDKETTVLLDFNHPLAGQDLTFDIELVEIA
jgi:FKBP-type peptidyl-prolyl cis-trans isomerase 2